MLQGLLLARSQHLLQVFEYLSGTSLFQLHESSSVTFTDVHLQRLIEYLGPLPEAFLSKCRSRDKYFDGQGEYISATFSTHRH